VPVRSQVLVAAVLATVLMVGCAAPQFTATPHPPTSTPLRPMTGSGGGRIAYAAYFRNGTGELYVMNVQDTLQGADGSDVRRLTYNTAEDNNRVWSPDGAQIAFHSNRQGRSSIYVTCADSRRDPFKSSGRARNRSSLLHGATWSTAPASPCPLAASLPRQVSASSRTTPGLNPTFRGRDSAMDGLS